VVEDLDDAAELRKVVLDRDERIIKSRAGLVTLERWIEQLEGQAAELLETAQQARSTAAHMRAMLPDLLEPEVDDLAARIAEDTRA
jgi:hypothetical protein